MRTLRHGAQRASLRSRLAGIIAASLLASVVAIGMSAAAPQPAAAMASPWRDVETYYLGLLNCTRTGGWVTKAGSCKGYGSGSYSRYVPPLRLGDGLSDVARGWARKIAISGDCRHGDPGARLRKAGFRGWAWGENIGCWDLKDVRAAVLNSHRSFQSEKSYGGGHWKNIKNDRYKVVGIGVWRENGHTRLVTDFYQP